MYGVGVAFGHLFFYLFLDWLVGVAGWLVEWFVFVLVAISVSSFIHPSIHSFIHSFILVGFSIAFNKKVSSFSFHISYACYSSEIYDGHVAVIWHKIFLAFYLVFCYFVYTDIALAVECMRFSFSFCSWLRLSCRLLQILHREFVSCLLFRFVLVLHNGLPHYLT